MPFSRPTLHPSVITRPEHRSALAARLVEIAESRRQSLRFGAALAVGHTVVLPLTTVSLGTNFDASIDVRFKGINTGSLTSLLMDSGNSTLIMPYFESLAALPNFTTDYTIVIDDVMEPWGARACIIRGPIEIPTTTHGIFTIQDCVFFACKGPNREGKRTANFGLGCIDPWSSTKRVLMRAPLAYDPTYKFAEIDYSPAGDVMGVPTQVTVLGGSALTLHASEPPGYRLFEILRHKFWMALTPRSLTIGAARTLWPGERPAPIAMVDTGGGPVFLSDPDGLVYDRVWPRNVSNPFWIGEGSISCQSVRDDLTFAIGDQKGAFSIEISENILPESSRNLTLVLCKKCEFMIEEYGMNIGGISALFNKILIDYGSKRVGFKPKI